MNIVEIEFSRHCAERWSERGRPWATVDAALSDLRALATFGRIEEAIPTATDPSGEPHLILGDYRFPLVRHRGKLVAVTCKVATRPRPGQRLESSSRIRTSGSRRRPAPYQRPRNADWLTLLDDDRPASPLL